MALTRADLDAGRCDGCGDPSHQHEPLYLHQRCHPDGGQLASYFDGVLTIRCAICEKTVADIAVAPGG